MDLIESVIITPIAALYLYLATNYRDGITGNLPTHIYEWYISLNPHTARRYWAFHGLQRVRLLGKMRQYPGIRDERFLTRH